ncbi:MAG: phosphoglycerate mutase [Deltaproteobacteria bacterium]|jgi:broad specificity phosphatase PhoE|nr:phosphoglycerate mutase [Deltaproteobacteria bacterium]
MKMNKMFVLLVLVTLFFPAFFCLAQDNETTTLILVRHAEEDRSKENIPLTEAGAKRAKELAWVMQNVKIDAVFSTPTDRTKSTARPMAETKGLETKSYAYKTYEDLQPFLDSILKNYRGKTVLISGHSDDVPAMLAMLRKDFGKGENVRIIDKPVYDNLFIVFVPPKGQVVVLNLKYGQSTP